MKLNWRFWTKRTRTRGTAAKENSVQLLEQLSAAERDHREKNILAWDEFETILARAAHPEPQDGSRLLDLQQLLDVPRAQIINAINVAARAGDYRDQISEAETRLAALQQQIKAADEAVALAQKQFQRTKADIDRLNADLPEEVARYGSAARAAVAMADRIGTAKGLFLKAHGWEMLGHSGWRKVNTHEGTTQIDNAVRLEVENILAPLARQFQQEWEMQGAARRAFPEPSAQLVEEVA